MSTLTYAIFLGLVFSCVAWLTCEVCQEWRIKAGLPLASVHLVLWSATTWAAGFPALFAVVATQLVMLFLVLWLQVESESSRPSLLYRLL